MDVEGKHMSRGPQKHSGGWCRHTGDWLSPRGGGLILKCYLPSITFQEENWGRTESSWEALTVPCGAERT